MTPRSVFKKDAWRSDFTFYERSAGIACAVAALAGQSHGAIVYGTSATTINTGDISPAGGLTVGLEIGSSFSSGAFGYVSGIGSLQLAEGALAGLFRVASGQSVSTGNFTAASFNQLAFLSENYVSNGQGGTDNYFAFRFTDAGVNGGAPVYGWARLELPALVPDAPGGLKILDWAYEDSGAAITMGAVPEPSGLALLALGAVGTAAFHRRRRTQAPA